MARKPAAKHIINQNKQLQLRAHFLRTISTVCPEVFTSLKEQVHLGSFTVGDWAKKFGLAETWVEVAAHETILLWASHPELVKNDVWVMPAGKAVNVFDWAQPPFKMRIPIPDDRAFGRQWFSWEDLKEYIRAQIEANLDHELEAFKSRCVKSIRAREVPLPRDMDKKMAVAALHLCRKLSPEKIGSLPGYGSVRSNVFRWIRETTSLLELEPSRRRRKK